MTMRIKIDGNEVEIAVTRVRQSGFREPISWTYFYVYDELNRPIAEHSVPTSWFNNPQCGFSIETGGHKYAHVRTVSF